MKRYILAIALVIVVALVVPARNITAATSALPIGYHEGATSVKTWGWACDPDQPNQAVYIHFYSEFNGQRRFIGAVAANLPREAAVASRCGGTANHGFEFIFPSDMYNNGTYKIFAYAINIDRNGQLAGSNPLLTKSPASVTLRANNLAWYIARSSLQNNKLYLDDTVEDIGDQTLYEPPVGVTGANPSWYIAQWNIPQELPRQAVPLGTGSGWKIENADARVVKSDTIELAQNGARLACGTEFDLFLQPINSQYPNYPQGFLQDLNSGPALAELKGLIYGFQALQIYESVVKRCTTPQQPRGDYGGITASLILSNIRTHQTLFYQIILRDSDAGYNNHACNSGTNWFSTSGAFGVNQTIGVYGQACLTPTANPNQSLTPYTLDVLDRLKLVIQSGPADLDKDLQNWKVTESYIGLGMNGSTMLTAKFADVYLYGVR